MPDGGASLAAIGSMIAQAVGSVGSAVSAGASSVAGLAAPAVVTNGAVDLWKVGGQAAINNLSKSPTQETDLPTFYGGQMMDKNMFAPSTQTQDISKLFQDPQLASLLGGEDMNTLADLFSRMDKGSGLK